MKKCTVKKCAVYRSDVRRRKERKGVGEKVEGSGMNVGRGGVLLRGESAAGCVWWGEGCEQSGAC